MVSTIATRSRLTFLGGVGTVTGSKFLVESGGHRVLVDCGLYQGLKELRLRNWAPPPVSPTSIDAVILTHAHLDHCGYLPALARSGFRGPVYCTPSTAQLAAIVLRDSAHLQEEDARYAREAGFSKHSPPLPLYTASDAEQAIALFRPVPYGRTTTLPRSSDVTLRRAGHILGSASVLVRTDHGSVVFSGDLGRPAHPLLRAPDRLPPAEVVVVESTYGGRTHPEPRVDEFGAALRRVVYRGGSVVIPAFAVDRTEIVLWRIAERVRSGKVPRVPVFVDSPMALAALDVYRGALRRGSDEFRPEVIRRGVPFDSRDLHEAHSVEESMMLNHPRSPCIIISASGMATGGRVVHHLKHLLPDRRNAVVLVGFQAAGTRGRALLEGARELRMHGRSVPVRAEVISFDDFSVHADATETLKWLATSPRRPRQTYVVHGEPDASAALVARIRSELGWPAIVPPMGDKVSL